MTDNDKKMLFHLTFQNNVRSFQSDSKKCQIICSGISKTPIGFRKCIIIVQNLSKILIHKEIEALVWYMNFANIKMLL